MFQETAARTLTEDIAKIVRSIKSSTQLVLKAIQEAEHQAELREQEWKAQQERWRREEDQRQIAKSVKDILAIRRNETAHTALVNTYEGFQPWALAQ